MVGSCGAVSSLAWTEPVSEPGRAPDVEQLQRAVGRGLFCKNKGQRLIPSHVRLHTPKVAARDCSPATELWPPAVRKMISFLLKSSYLTKFVYWAVSGIRGLVGMPQEREWQVEALATVPREVKDVCAAPPRKRDTVQMEPHQVSQTEQTSVRKVIPQTARWWLLGVYSKELWRGTDVEGCKDRSTVPGVTLTPPRSPPAQNLLREIAQTSFQPGAAGREMLTRRPLLRLCPGQEGQGRRAHVQQEPEELGSAAVPSTLCGSQPRGCARPDLINKRSRLRSGVSPVCGAVSVSRARSPCSVSLAANYSFKCDRLFLIWQLGGCWRK